jgi:hypothetical protein
MMLFFLTVDMIIPLLIVGVGSACLAKTVSSAFRIIIITELPVTHTKCSRVNIRDKTGGICLDIFPLFGAGIRADTALYNLPVTEPLVSRSMKPCHLGEKKPLLYCVKVRWAYK